MKRLDERGHLCPMPVVETKRYIEATNGRERVEVLVDNDIAMQNVSKMLDYKKIPYRIEEMTGGEYRILTEAAEENVSEEIERTTDLEKLSESGRVLVVGSDTMGNGDAALGKILMKGFIYAISHQEVLPEQILMFNSGIFLACEGSESLEDLREMEELGTKICVCGTCLDYYQKLDQLRVGCVVNMYDIAEAMMKARQLIRP